MFERPFYQASLKQFSNAGLVKVLTGMRRVGKSTLMKLYAQDVASSMEHEVNLLHIDMERMEFSGIRNDSDLYALVRSRITHPDSGETDGGQRNLVLIDKVQEIPHWEKAVNALLNDGDSDITITGSNASLMSSELATLLTGRYVEIPVYPLTWSEYLTFRDSDGTDAFFADFLRLGGMPGIHHLDFQDDAVLQYLSSLLDSIVLKDIVARFGVRDVDLLRRIVLFMADNSANVFSARRIADFLKKERRATGVETIYNYVSYLVSAFLAWRIPRYDIKGKRLLETTEKFVFADLGMKTALLGYRPGDINTALEAVVYFELKKRGYQVYVGAMDSAEIDYVAEKAGRRLYIQVCYLLADDSVVQREFTPLKAIRDSHPKIVLSMDRVPIGARDGIQHHYIPDFLRDESAVYG